MKNVIKIICFFSVLFIFTGVSLAQETIIFDWDGNEGLKWVYSQFSSNGGTHGDGIPNGVSNPDADGVNNSANCASLDADVTSQWNALTIYIDYKGGAIDISNQQIFHMKMHCSQSHTWKVKVRDTAGSESNFVTCQYTDTGNWQDLVFDFTNNMGSADPTAIYVYVIVCDEPYPFDADFYVDDQRFNNDPNPYSGTPPTTPTLDAPASAASGTNYNVTWTSSDNHTRYCLQEDTNSNFTNPTTSYPTSGATSATFNHSVGSSTTYYYRIRAENQTTGLNSNWSNVDNTVVNPIPSTPTLTAPSSATSGNDYSVTWTASDNHTRYCLQEDTDSNFSNPTTSYPTSGATSATFNHTVGSSTTYYYRIRAENETTGLNSDWSNVDDTVVEPEAQAPSTPTLDAPTSATSGVNYSVTWTASDNHTRYCLQEDTDSNFSSPTTSYPTSGATSATFNHSVGASTTYYYRIRAENETSGLNSNWSNVDNTTVNPSGGGPTNETVIFDWDGNEGLKWMFSQFSSNSGTHGEGVPNGVANPDADDVNGSSYCASINADVVSQWNALTCYIAYVGGAIDISNQMVFHMKMRCNTAHTWRVRLRDTGSNETAYLTCDYTDVNNWQDLVFDFTGQMGGVDPTHIYVYVVSCGDPYSLDTDVYFDDMRFNDDPNPYGGGGGAQTPSTPTLTAPSSATSGNDYSVTWTASDNHTRYCLQEDTDSNFSSPTTSYPTSGATSATFNHTVGSSTTYYYRIRAENETTGLNSNWSNVDDTVVEPEAQAPSTPTLTAPSSATSGNDYSVTWTASDNHTRYCLQEDTDSNFSSPTTSYPSSGATSATFNHSVSSATTYYYRIRAENETTGLNSNWSNVDNTTVNPPSGPTSETVIFDWDGTEGLKWVFSQFSSNSGTHGEGVPNGVANPDADDVNGSSYCASINADVVSEWNALTCYIGYKGDAIDISSEMVFHMKMRCNTSHTWRVKLRDTGSNETAYLTCDYTDVNNWQDLVFDFTGQMSGVDATNIYVYVVSCGDPYSLDTDVYFDDMRFNDDPNPYGGSGGAQTPSTPTLSAPASATSGSDYSVTWTASDNHTRYCLQEDTDSNFSSPMTLYPTSGATSATFNHTVGSSTTYYYRIRAENETTGLNSNWSNVDNTVVDTQPPPPGPLGCGTTVRTKIEPNNYHTFTLPSVGGWWIDQDPFNTKIIRCTDSGEQNTSWAYHRYSSKCVFNHNSDYFICRHLSGGDAWIHDGRNGLPLKPSLTDQLEGVWSRFDPNKYYFMQPYGNELKCYDVSTDQVTTIRTFSGEDDIEFGGGEGDISEDGRYVCISSTNSTRWFVYDIIDDIKYTVKTVGTNVIDAAQISPSGQYVVLEFKSEGNNDGQGCCLYDAQTMTFIRNLYYSCQHNDVGYDSNGDEALFIVYPQAQLYSFNAVLSIKFSNAAVTILHEYDVSTRVAYHFSQRCCGTRHDYVFCENYSDNYGGYIEPESDGWKPFLNEILAIPTDGSGNTVRLCHHRSIYPTSDDPDWYAHWQYEPCASVNRQGDRLVYRTRNGSIDHDWTEVMMVVIDEPETVAPLKPVNLTVAEQTSNMVRLTWSQPAAASDGEYPRSYQVVRDGAHLAFTNALEYADTTVQSGQNYQYRVYSYDAQANISVDYASVNVGVQKGVAEDFENESYNEAIPEKYALYQNTPNPFNSETMISYDLPEAGRVQLNIYDIQGRKVGTFLDNYMSQGKHQVRIYCNQLPSGVYFYELKTHNFCQRKKMSLLK